MLFTKCKVNDKGAALHFIPESRRDNKILSHDGRGEAKRGVLLVSRGCG